MKILKRKASLSDVVGGTWAMDQRYLSAFMEECRANFELRSKLLSEAADDEPASIAAEQSGSVVVIEMDGPFMKNVPEWLSFFGVSAVDSTLAAQVVRAAAADPGVESILLHLDSPGGQVAGTEELGLAVAEAAKAKPVHAHISDLGASAAYWVASQATTISANRTAEVGSIGTLAVVYDTSAAFEDEGVQVHVVSSGGHKGAFTDGAPIKEEDLAMLQEDIDGLTSIFVEAVASGRGMESAHAGGLASGRTWLAEQALKLGLIDKVQTFSEALASVTAPKLGAQEGGEMTEEVIDQELEAETPAESIEAEAAEVEEVELDEKEAELAAAKAEAEAAKAALREYKEAQKAELIAQGIQAGQITPPMTATVSDFAVTCGEDVDRLRSFISVLPVQVHAEVSGAPEAADKPQLSAEEKKVAKLFDVTEEEFAAANAGE